MRLLLLGGLGALVMGQAAVAAAFPVPALFTPGIWLVGLGLLSCAAAGILSLAGPDPESAVVKRAPPRPQAAERR